MMQYFIQRDSSLTHLPVSHNQSSNDFKTSKHSRLLGKIEFAESKYNSDYEDDDFEMEDFFDSATQFRRSLIPKKKKLGRRGKRKNGSKKSPQKVKPKIKRHKKPLG